MKASLGSFSVGVSLAEMFFWERLQTGDEIDEVLDVTSDDFVSVEFRFGPGRSQKAHRYTVSRTSTEIGQNKLDLPFSEYEYQDYVDVPFEMWDI